MRTAVLWKCLLSLEESGFAEGMKILVVPDKFKGTLGAREAAEAIRAGWLESRPRDEVECLPMSDGGEGFGELMGETLGAEERRVKTVNAAHERIEAAWWHGRESSTAIVETARVIGLAMLPRGRWHPFELDTFGLGAIFREAAAAGVRSCIVGIGGSATNDGGFGMARGLGFRFWNGEGKEVGQWTELEQLERIEPPEKPLVFEECTIACDVQNRLLGPEGATRIYGPQKGLRAEDFARAEGCLGRLAEVVKRDLGRDAQMEAGTGAAGGLGFGLRVFLGGRFEAGFGIYARHAKLHDKVNAADLVVTAEGGIDVQSMMGKGTGAVAKICAEHRKACIGLAGSLDRAALDQQQGGNFTRLYGMHPDLATPEEAMTKAAFWLERLAAKAAKETAG